MCGIAGILKYAPDPQLGDIVRKMTKVLAHRGPDAEGHFSTDRIAIGQQRLAIIDLDPRGNQPMYSVDGRHVLILNGEIYNYKELKAELRSYPYRTETDTEVILAAYAAWGDKFLERLIGMFAIAIWDKEKEILLIARDRMGIKPLYYAQEEGFFAFASEIRGLTASGLIPPKVRAGAAAEFLAWSTIYGPETGIKGIKSLLPGEFIKISTDSAGKGRAEARQFATHLWKGLEPLEGLSEKAIQQGIRHRLLKAVERRLIADVPLGAFLSGGIDSSVIVGLMAEVSQQAVSTFSVVFNEKDYDESPWSNMIAQKFNTDHHPILLKPEDFLRQLPNALKAMDYPSGDGINSYVVSKVTRQAGITVALSGLGGDELFAGYPVFGQIPSLQSRKLLWALPAPLRRMMAGPAGGLIGGRKGKRIAELLGLPGGDFKDLYPVFRRVFSDKQLNALFGNKLDREFRPALIAAELQNSIPDSLSLSRISIAEIRTYTDSVLLRDTDQMSMAHALEVRVPFFDHELVDYVLRIPDSYKLSDGKTPKKLLVDSLQGLLPDEVVHRKKMGFTFPWEYWLKNDLKPLCESNLGRLKDRNLFNADAVDRFWKDFLAGKGGVLWMHIWLLVIWEEWLGNNGIEG